MIVTRLAIAAGAAVVGLLCWLAVAGVVVATELLITAGALVVLVGGGNWLGGHYAPARGGSGAVRDERAVNDEGQPTGGDDRASTREEPAP